MAVVYVDGGLRKLARGGRDEATPLSPSVRHRVSRLTSSLPRLNPKIAPQLKGSTITMASKLEKTILRQQQK